MITVDQPWLIISPSHADLTEQPADLSADDAARWEGIYVDGKVLSANDSFRAIAEGRLGPPKNGGPVTLNCIRMVLESDFRSPIREGMNYRLASFLRMSSLQGSN